MNDFLKNWIPYKLIDNNTCRWLYTGDQMFIHPFFDETIQHCQSLPFNSKMKKVISSLEMLNEWSPTIDAIEPTAIIFHVSRCGSTLLSQMLSLDPSNIALSEVPFFDFVLRMGFRTGAMDRSKKLFQSSVKFYGTKRNDQQKHLFIKADSWHVHFYKEIRECYPDTPIILLYRRPDEVIRSHQKLRGMHAVQGVIEPELFGFDKGVFDISLDEYTAKVLETYYAAYVNILKTDKNVLAVDYKEGMIPIMQKIAGFCNFSIEENIMEQMKERAGYNAKFPGKKFESENAVDKLPSYQLGAMDRYREIGRV